MYIFPGYINFRQSDNAIFVTSQLFQNTVKITEYALQQEFHSLVQHGGCSELSTPLTKFLHEQDLLVTESEICDALNQTKQLLQDILSITIMPTEGCNFRCPYCYENHMPVVMRQEIIEQIRRYLALQCPHFKIVQLAWFGGEPTLCKNVVLDTSAFVQALSHEYPFDFQSSMTTNGYLLDFDTFLQFYAHGITHYQITLDGWGHDKTRPHVSGKGTLRKILDNLTSISALPKDKYQFHINLRHNILADDEDFSWYDYLYKQFGSDDRFSVMVRAVGNWGGETVHELNILKGRPQEQLLLRHIDYLHKIGMKCGNGHDGLFSKICYSSFPHSMVFRADGKIEKCTVCLDHPQNYLGRVDPEKGVFINSETNQLWSSSDLERKCYRCPDVLSCFNMKCKKRTLVDGLPERPCTHTISSIY